MKHPLFLLVFLSGIGVAIIATLLSACLRPTQQQQQSEDLFADLVALSSIVDEKSTLHDHIQNQLQRSKSTELQSTKECEAEALKTVSVALSSKDHQSPKRAHKLFNHAMALCPRHPTVLNYFGEFLEATGEDMLKADHLYVRALSYSETDSEEHRRALQNRKRTAVIVEEIDRIVLRRIDEKKKALQRISDSSASLKRVKKEAYFQHIYHTIGIEGSTMTLAQTRSILETKLAVGGKNIIEHNEILGLDAALRYINHTLVDKVGEVTLDDILQIHKRVIGYVDPIEAGMIRQTQIYVGAHVPPPPSHVDLLLQRFVLWLNSPENLDMHPVRLAALLHYKLVYIHPFIDGNGRTSRLLMNLILMQSGFPPVIIRKQDRLLYFQHLVTANEGDIRPFVRFIAECTEQTLDAYTMAAQEIVPSSSRHDHMQFLDDDSETTIPAQDHLDHHDKIIMGGMVGDNITVSP